MKRIAQFIVAIPLLFISTSVLALDAPELTVTTSGLDLSLSWTPITGAVGYTLYYAPSPYTGPDTVKNVDMKTNTSFSTTLWDGASYYVAITASDSSGESGYSNIGLFALNNTNIIGKYNGLYRGAGTVDFNTQNACKATVMEFEILDGTISGTATESMQDGGGIDYVTGNVNINGEVFGSTSNGATIVGVTTITDDFTMSGTWEVSGFCGGTFTATKDK